MPTIRGVPKDPPWAEDDPGQLRKELDRLTGMQMVLPANPLANAIASGKYNPGGILTVRDGESFTIGGNMASSSEYSPDTLANMVRMRLRSKPSSYFEHWHFHKTLRKGESLVVGLIIQDGEVTVLEDAWALFPSDQLITQLRLLEK